jgi:polysaccharide chain length determinant protein (PEP-CTERM system associated)
MLGHRQLEPHDYLEILRRRWWIILVPTVVGCVGVYLASLLLHEQYTSTTLVLVEGQKVPENYVKSVVTEDIGEQLGTMQQQIMSRTRLQPIVEKFDLYKSEKGKLTMEDRIDLLRKAISVDPVKSLISSNKNQLPGFTISFTADDPRQAQQVCSEITSMFIEENLKLREQSATGTTDFLKTQLDDAKKRLDEQDARMADFKRKYMGSLPGNEQTDMNLMTSSASQLDAVTNELTRAQQDKTYAESLLAQQVSAWQASQKPDEVNQDSLEQQLGNLQAQLVAMRAHYTEDYPDVVQLKQNIAALQKKIADSKANSESGTSQAQTSAKRPEPPQIQQLRLQMHNMDILIRQKTQDQARLRQQLASYQRRISMSPAVEEEYKAITRDHQTALQFYNDLLAKTDQSEMARDLERRQQGEQFRLMDPADLPAKPSFPNRPLFAGVGLGVGFALGIGISLLLELLDKSLRTENDVELMLGLPTLAMVPVIDPRRKIKKQAA